MPGEKGRNNLWLCYVSSLAATSPEERWTGQRRPQIRQTRPLPSIKHNSAGASLYSLYLRHCWPKQSKPRRGRRSSAVLWSCVHTNGQTGTSMGAGLGWGLWKRGRVGRFLLSFVFFLSKGQTGWGWTSSFFPSVMIQVEFICSFIYLTCFGFHRGNKPANSPKGQPPDADGHSSVTDLANSLTGDMVMVGHAAIL